MFPVSIGRYGNTSHGNGFPTRMWVVGQLIHGNPGECDFTSKFGKLPDAVALDLNDRYRGWKLGIMASIAIVPAECFELNGRVDCLLNWAMK